MKTIDTWLDDMDWVLFEKSYKNMQYPFVFHVFNKVDNFFLFFSYFFKLSILQKNNFFDDLSSGKTLNKSKIKIDLNKIT